MPRPIPAAILACCLLGPIPAADPAAPAAKSEVLDLTRDGAYTSGAWTYRVRVHNPGTRSQATVGTLTRDGKDLPAAAEGKPVETPWGPMAWHGERGTLEAGGKPWGDFGWRPVIQERVKPGRELDPRGHIKEGSVAEEKHIDK